MMTLKTILMMEYKCLCFPEIGKCFSFYINLICMVVYYYVKNMIGELECYKQKENLNRLNIQHEVELECFD